MVYKLWSVVLLQNTIIVELDTEKSYLYHLNFQKYFYNYMIVYHLLTFLIFWIFNSYYLRIYLCKSILVYLQNFIQINNIKTGFLN